LVEVLVAMVILMVIVLMMANLMRHTASAWEVGMLNVGVSMEGRAALDLMAREISAGLMDETLSEGSITDGGSSVSFYLLGDPDVENGTRAARLVTYNFAGTTLNREEKPLSVDTYPTSGAGDGPVPLLSEVTEFDVEAPSGSYTTNMPAWVGVRIVLAQESMADATVKVWSKGRKPADTNGWIRSWR
jgi:hypothetical protein